MAAKKATKKTNGVAKTRTEVALPKGFKAARTRLDGFFEREVGNSVQGVLRGAFKVTVGFLAEFGPWRVIDAPLSEIAIAGSGF